MSLKIIVAGLLLFLGMAHAPFVGAQTYDFSVTLSANDGAGLSPGDTVQLTVDVHNGGPSSSTPSDSLVIDIPNVFSFNGAVSCLTYTQGTSGSNITFMWNQIPEGGGSLAPGQDAICTIGLTLNSFPPGGATATATLNPSTFQINSGNDSSNYTFNINPPPTISQALAASVSGQDVTLTFGASNANTCTGSSTPAAAGWDSMTLCSSAAACANVSVALTNLAPATYSFTATCTNPSGSVMSQKNATVVVSAPTFPQPLAASASGQTVTLTFGASNADSCTASSVPVVAGWSGTLCSTAAACSSQSATLTNVPVGPYTFSVDCSNVGGSTNSSAPLTVGASIPTTDLSVSAIVTQGIITPGQQFVFNFTAQNLGAQDALGAQVEVTTPSQIQILSSNCGLATGSGASTWNIGTLTAGATTTCDVQAKLLSSGPSIAEILTISFAGTDTDSSNDSAVVAVTVGSSVDLSVNLSIADSSHLYAAGDQVVIAMTVADAAAAGDATAVAATFNVTNATALTGLNSDVCGTPDVKGQLTWNVGNLAHGANKTCTLTGTIASASTAIPVSANVTPTQNDSSLGNNASNLVIQTYQPPVSESTTVSGAPTTEPSTHVSLSKDGSVAVFESQENDLVQINTNTNGQDIYSVGSGGHPVLETFDSQGHQLIGTSSLPAVSGDGSIVAFAYTAGAAKQAKDAIASNMWSGHSGQSKHQVDNGMGGAAPNGPVSGAPSVASAGGSNKLVFCSAASNLVASDTNGARDVFLVDPSNAAQATQLVSTDSTGKQLPGDSCEPKLSADGTKVVFTVLAPTFFGPTNNAFRQVVRKDLTTGALELISLTKVPAGPAAHGDSSEPTISADGSVIAFTSAASDLDDLGAPVGGKEAFVSLAQSGADGASRTIKRVRSGDGTVPNGLSQHPQLSNDGTTVVMQTAATNFFGAAKALTSSGCGSVAITTNFFTPAAMGSALCTGQTSNQNPAISGDGATTGFDSNAPQSGTSSNNANAYSQGVGSGSIGVANLSGDFSGQWFDPNQNGQGLVIDVIRPDASNNRLLLLTWFVYQNGQPSWVQGVGVPHSGSGTQAGLVVVQMDQVAIFKGASFPLGAAHAAVALWGSITLTFTDANTGSMRWTSSYPGFNSGTMAITHFLPVGLPAQDAPGAQVKACHSGNWFNPAQSGHGFEFEVIPATPPVLSVDWFAFAPNGTPVWLQGAGAISGNSAQMHLQLIDGTGAQFPPSYNPNAINHHDWGTATFTFADAGHATVTWNSTIPGYGSGTQPLQPLVVGLMDRRTCQ